MGEQRFGRYTLLSRIGSGGMAEVFLAKTQGMGGFEKRLAVKRLLPAFTEDPQTVELLGDEARIAVHLTHPNIVQVFDFGRVDSDYFIAMEYVEGVDLRSFLHRGRDNVEPFPLHLTLYVVHSVLEALDFAHHAKSNEGKALNVVHRDVTPHNILLSRYGEVKLADFGVARAAISQHLSVAGDVLGKFSYMPPEQACGGDIDHRVDIFAVGAILYELLAGHPLYRSGNLAEQMRSLRNSIVPPSTFRQEIPKALDEICLQALAPEPSDRFATAADFSRAVYKQFTSLPQRGAIISKSELAQRVETRFEEVRRQRAGGERPEPMKRDDYSFDATSLLKNLPNPALADTVYAPPKSGTPSLKKPVDRSPKAYEATAYANASPTPMSPAEKEVIPVAPLPKAPTPPPTGSSGRQPIEDLSSEVTILRDTDPAASQNPHPWQRFIAIGLLLAALMIGIALAVWIATAPERGEAVGGPVTPSVDSKTRQT